MQRHTFRGLRILGPWERGPVVQPLCDLEPTVPVPQDGLYGLPALTAKNEDGLRERIHPHFVLDQQGKPDCTFPEIGIPGSYVVLVFFKLDHIKSLLAYGIRVLRCLEAMKLLFNCRLRRCPANRAL